MLPVDFSSLLCSRLCHDLISPIGALNNGIELLEDDDNDNERQKQCLALLKESALQASNRLKFFRLAFGSGGNYEANIPMGEVKSAISGLFPAEKVTIQWLVADTALPKTAVKVLLNLSLIAGESLVRGGTLSLAAERHGKFIEIGVKAEGPKTVLSDDFRRALEGTLPKESIDSRAAPAALARQLIVNTEGRIQVSPTGTVLVIAAQITA